MTLEEARKMKPDEKRVKLAVLRGYKHGFSHLGDQKLDRWLIPGSDPSYIHNWLSTGNLPDYCNDLNAVHEARKALPPDQRAKYIHALENLPTVSTQAHECGWSFAIANASADDHATALIRALSVPE